MGSTGYGIYFGGTALDGQPYIRWNNTTGNKAFEFYESYSSAWAKMQALTFKNSLGIEVAYTNDSRLHNANLAGHSFISNQTLNTTDDVVFSKLSIDAGSGCLKLKPGATNNHTYMELYSDSSNPNTRSGYVGYGTSGSKNLSIGNEVSTGNIIFQLSGGTVKVGTNDVWHDGNVTIGTGLNNSSRTLSAYGSTTGTAVEGNKQVVTAGTNLSGGGTITLGLVGQLPPIR